MAHHLALPGIAVHVAAEERRCEEQGDGPDGDDEHYPLHRDPGAAEVAEESQPHPAEQDKPPKTAMRARSAAAS